jgi:hypothetical protein
MTVEMGIRHRDTGEYEVVPVATSDTFCRIWLPACKRLGLEWVAHFHDGALAVVPPESVPQIIAELERLRAGLAEQRELAFVIERIDSILRAFRKTDPAVCEYDFG